MFHVSGNLQKMKKTEKAVDHSSQSTTVKATMVFIQLCRFSVQACCSFDSLRLLKGRFCHLFISSVKLCKI